MLYILQIDLCFYVVGKGGRKWWVCILPLCFTSHTHTFLWRILNKNVHFIALFAIKVCFSRGQIVIFAILYVSPIYMYCMFTSPIPMLLPTLYIFPEGNWWLRKPPIHLGQRLVPCTQQPYHSRWTQQEHHHLALLQCWWFPRRLWFAQPQENLALD